MSTEIPIETVPVETVVNTDLPEVAETQIQGETAPQEVATSDTQEQAQPSEIETYQEILAKYDDDNNYQMTDEEIDVYDSVSEKVRDGKIEEPAKKGTEEKSEKTEGEPEATDGTQEKPAETTQDFNLSNENADTLQKAMTSIGAKDISELNTKVQGLIDGVKKSGGKLGAELKEVKGREANHLKWIEDYRAGKPEAIAHFNELMGDNNTPNTAKQTNEAETVEFDIDDYMDEGLAKYVKGQDSAIAKLTATVEKLTGNETKRVEDSEYSAATNGWVDDIVDLVSHNQKVFNLTASEARELGKKYFGGSNEALHPKFEQIDKLIRYAHEKNMPDLKTAHIMFQHENGGFVNQLIDAEKKGQKSTQHKPSVNASLSNLQGRVKNNEQDPHIDESSITKMEQGEMNVPDSWTDESGTLIKGKIPKRFHKRLFPRG